MIFFSRYSYYTVTTRHVVDIMTISRHGRATYPPYVCSLDSEATNVFFIKNYGAVHLGNRNGRMSDITDDV